MTKLSPEAIEKFGQLFRKFKEAPTQQLKKEMISIFAPQIERKAAKIAAESGGRISAVDYAQDLYLEFLEMLKRSGEEEKRVFKKFSTMLSTTKPSKNARTTFEFNYIEELSPREELNHLSVRPGEQTLLQKAEEIVASAKLTKTEREVVSKFLEGKSFTKIGDEIDLQTERVRQIYYKALKRLNHPDRKIKASRILYDDLPLNGSEPPTEYVKVILNDIIGQCCGGRRDITAFSLNKIKPSKKFLDIYVDTCIHIKLPERYNSPEFKNLAKKISFEYYGRNIFEFI